MKNLLSNFFLRVSHLLTCYCLPPYCTSKVCLQTKQDCRRSANLTLRLFHLPTQYICEDVKCKFISSIIPKATICWVYEFREVSSCRLHPEPFFFRTSSPTGLHKSQRSVWESVPPCPLSNMPHSYFHSLHNNWLRGDLCRKRILVSEAVEVLWRHMETLPGVGKSHGYAIKRTK